MQGPGEYVFKWAERR